MADKPVEENNKAMDIFSFERKLVELVEELRFRRDLEVENEKTMKSVLDEKYKSDTEYDELHRKHMREKDELEQQIALLKRRLEDKICISDDEKVKQQMIAKTYGQEIRTLKEELRTAKTEKLILNKKVQELDGKLKLHNNFQDSISNQLSEIRKSIKLLSEQCRDLANEQQKLLQIVADAKMAFKKYDLCNQNIQQSLVMSEKKNARLTKELLDCRTELTMLKSSKVPPAKPINNYINVEKIHNRNLELENLFLKSRKENEKTLSNFINCQKELCKFMKKYADADEEKCKAVEEVEKQLEASKKQVELLEQNLHDLKERLADKKNKNTKNTLTVYTQTSGHSYNFESPSSKNELLPSPVFPSDYESNSVKCLDNTSQTFNNNQTFSSRFESNIMLEIMKKQVTNSYDSTTTVELQNQRLILKGNVGKIHYQGMDPLDIDKRSEDPNGMICCDSAFKKSAEIPVRENGSTSKNISTLDSVKCRTELSTKRGQAFENQDLISEERPFKLLKVDTSIKNISSIANPEADSATKSVADYNATKFIKKALLVDTENISPTISLAALNLFNSEKKTIVNFCKLSEGANEYGLMPSAEKSWVGSRKVDDQANLKVDQNESEIKEISGNVADKTASNGEESIVLPENAASEKKSEENGKGSVDASISCDASEKSSVRSSLKEITKSAMKYVSFLSGNT